MFYETGALLSMVQFLTEIYISFIVIYRSWKSNFSIERRKKWIFFLWLLFQTVQSSGVPRQVNGDSSHNHNGYPTTATTSSHNALNPMNNLNGINAQAAYDGKWQSK